ncbi:MAG: ribonuclease HII [Candidatus Goldiibacteriota bacterium]
MDYGCILAGVDEAGRGPWAGPVVAAAVILDTDKLDTLTRLDDSKKLTEKTREELFDIVISAAVSYSICAVSGKQIDSTDILRATMRAMSSAIKGLGAAPDKVLIDGNTLPAAPGFKMEAVVGGDAKSLCVAAASVLAKVHRDRIMRNFDRIYPGYGFFRHKGYGTREHEEALEKLGVCPIHRISYKPVKKHIRG